jgi:hypothetical protein
MPPGEAYGSQGQQQQHHQFQHVHPQAQQLQHQHQHQHLAPLHAGLQAPPPLLPHPQFANPYPNGNQQYQHQHQHQLQHQQQQQHQQQHLQYVHPSYTQQQQQPVQFYPNNAPPPLPQQQQQQQYSNYNGTFHHQPAPAFAPAPQAAPLPQPLPVSTPMPTSIQFVNPSYLQHSPTPRPPNNAFPASQPHTPSTMSPQLPRAVQPNPPKPMPVKASPKLEEKRPPSRGTPKLLTRDPRRPSSSAGVAKSPITPHASTHTETLPLLLSVAEDCFEKANAAAQQVAKTMSPSEVAEHHKLVATGLGCLDVALKSNKLWPRLEARLCLRYTSILIEETTNITEAETALTRGISVCEKVWDIARQKKERQLTTVRRPSIGSSTSNTARNFS